MRKRATIVLSVTVLGVVLLTFIKRVSLLFSVYSKKVFPYIAELDPCTISLIFNSAVTTTWLFFALLRNSKKFGKTYIQGQKKKIGVTRDSRIEWKGRSRHNHRCLSLMGYGPFYWNFFSWRRTNCGRRKSHSSLSDFHARHRASSLSLAQISFLRALGGPHCPKNIQKIGVY